MRGRKSQMNKKYYYEIHIFLGRSDGYSRFFESDRHLEGEDDIIEEAINKIPDIEGDIDLCDYAQEITEDDYIEYTIR